MEVNTKYNSPLVLENIEIVESVFRKNDSKLDDVELGLNVKHEISEITKDEYEIVLVTTVMDEAEKLFVSVTTKALFHTEQENRDMIEKNTIAIMFPYIRSYISLITTQPGMTPIVLPAMNIVAMINDQQK